MDEFKIITFLAQVSLIKPVTNAWSERGANTVKRVKSCRRSTMINDLLNALLNISINGPAYNSNDTKQLISEAAVKFESSKRQKKPNSYRSCTKQRLASTQVTQVPSSCHFIESDDKDIKQDLVEEASNAISTNIVRKRVVTWILWMAFNSFKPRSANYFMISKLFCTIKLLKVLRCWHFLADLLAIPHWITLLMQ